MVVLKIKHSVTGELRRLSVGEPLTLEVLDRHLRVIFCDQLPNPYALKYSDPEGDVISISSNLELQGALATFGSNPVHLQLSPATSSETASFPNSRFDSLRSSALFPQSSSPFRGGLRFSMTASSSASSSSSPFTPRVFPAPSAVEILPAVRVSEWAPEPFIAGLDFLVTQNYNSEKCLNVLIDFGGAVDAADKAIRAQISAFLCNTGEHSEPIATILFPTGFVRALLTLEKSGYARRPAVAALIRNGGVTANAGVELAGAVNHHRCPQGHDMGVSSYNLGTYTTGWFCDRCKKTGQPGQRWRCVSGCEFDVCFACLPAPPSPVETPAPQDLPPGTGFSDFSLPPALLIPVRQLEAMGFTDRMRVIELIVQHAGDITSAAVQLSDERRQQDLEAERAREEERRRQEEEERRRNEAEAEQRRQEEAAREAERLSKRNEAAEIARNNPELIGERLNYLLALGFDPISSTTSLFNTGLNLDLAVEELLNSHMPVYPSN